MNKQLCVSKKIVFLGSVFVIILSFLYVLSYISSQKITQQTKASNVTPVARGINAYQGQFPFMAGIYIKQPGKPPYTTSDYKTYTYDLTDKILCGGTLINKRYILTTASCLLKTNPNTGATTPLTTDDLGVVLNLAKTSGSFTDNDNSLLAYFPEVSAIRSYYNIASIPTSFNPKDIPDDQNYALIMLNLPNENAPFAALPSTSSTYSIGSLVTVLGYGYTQTGPANTLQYLSGPVTAITSGIINTGKEVGWIDRVLNPAKVTGTCSRDLGGPLLYSENGIQTVIGIILGPKNRLGCGGHLDNYLEVKNIIPWLQSTIASLESHPQLKQDKNSEK